MRLQVVQQSASGEANQYMYVLAGLLVTQQRLFESA
jgi:hypothetical protein